MQQGGYVGATRVRERQVYCPWTGPARWRQVLLEKCHRKRYPCRCQSSQPITMMSFFVLPFCHISRSINYQLAIIKRRQRYLRRSSVGAKLALCCWILDVANLSIKQLQWLSYLKLAVWPLQACLFLPLSWSAATSHRMLFSSILETGGARWKILLMRFSSTYGEVFGNLSFVMSCLLLLLLTPLS